jgi:hypothetical protein
MAAMSAWICDHVPGTGCQECYRVLYERAQQIEQENHRLRQALERMSQIARTTLEFETKS